jgi:hypothetical protein
MQTPRVLARDDQYFAGLAYCRESMSKQRVKVHALALTNNVRLIVEFEQQSAVENVKPLFALVASG